MGKKSPNTICFVTGGRADFGLLRFLIEDVKKHFPVQLIATGMHLAPQFGDTYKEIEEAGFKIDEKVDLQIRDDSALDVTQAMGRATIGLAAAFDRLKPDLVFLLGDRSEIFAAAQAALVALIPVAHVAGGDTTEGAIDEAFRHGITKMAHLHFTTNAESAARVRQLGENPSHVYNVGHIGIDSIQRTEKMTVETLERELQWTFRKRNIVITFHPATLEPGSAERDSKELLNALDGFGPDLGLIFTLSNSDSEASRVNRLIEKFCEGRAHAKAVASLGRLKYINLMRVVDAIVGNSSSGIYEAPALGKPSVNIGNRQRGRLQSSSVLNCTAEQKEIYATVLSALSVKPSRVSHPYGDGHTIARIIEILKSIADFKPLVKKHFYSIEPRPEIP